MRKSDGRAAKAVGLTLGDLCLRLRGLRLSQGDLTAAQKSAEAIVCAGQRMNHGG